jgi:YgiT-type zinc finger domain-containing protein
MTGKPANNHLCPVCGGKLHRKQTTVPFLFTEAVVLVKDVPADVCASCHEPYMSGKVTDRVTELLRPLKDLKAEILILSYGEGKRALVSEPVLHV